MICICLTRISLTRIPQTRILLARVSLCNTCFNMYHDMIGILHIGMQCQLSLLMACVTCNKETVREQ